MTDSRSDDEEFERIVAGLDLSVPGPDDPTDEPHPTGAGGSSTDQAGPDDVFATHGVFQPRWSDRLPADERSDDDFDDGEDFIPPDPGPPPRGDRATRAAWFALIGGPILLFLLAVLDAPVPGIIPGTIVVGFVVAVVVLLIRRGDHDRGDDPDHGAVL